MPTGYWPFAKKDRNGPGPKGRVNKRSDRWSCKCKRESKRWSVCKCVARKTAAGRPSRAKKTVRIDLEKKKKYGKLWRRYTKAIRDKQRAAAAKSARKAAA